MRATSGKAIFASSNIENLRVLIGLMEYWNIGMLRINPFFHYSIIPVLHGSTAPSFHDSIIPFFCTFISLVLPHQRSIAVRRRSQNQIRFP
jgi:hypothetical protein